MSITGIQGFNAENHDWVVREQDTEMATLQYRDTGELATIHLDDLQQLNG